MSFLTLRHVPCRKVETRLPRPFLTPPQQVYRGSQVKVHCQSEGFENVTEAKTGVSFPTTLNMWGSDVETMRLVGTGCREKKVLMFGAKVYAIAAYVEGAKAARELGIRKRGGFFETAGTDEYTLAALDGAFSKLLLIVLVREVEGELFVEALEEALQPRMSLTGQLSVLEDFKNFFLGKVLQKGTQVVLLWNPVTSMLQIKLITNGSQEFSKVLPDKEMESASLCRALFEVWMGDNAVIPDAREDFGKGIRTLMDSDTEARDEFKPGGRGTDI